MNKRYELQDKLEELLGSNNVYFQPPEKTKIKYPCIIYNLNNIDVQHADNKSYKINKSYTVTYIDRNPDSPIIDKILELPGCSYDRFFTVDGLNHYNYTLFY